MNANVEAVNRSDAALEALAAELTDAAFPVVLQRGIGEEWLELKLDLWRALDGAVKKSIPELCDEHYGD
jgi:hypothetical protein